MSQCKGGKKAKQHFTVCLIANAACGKEVASIIWKSKKPRCFKGIDVSKLAVKYELLTKVNRQSSF